MKKRINFLFSALMICAAVEVFVGCADNSIYEPKEQAQKREQFKEKLSHEVTQAEARQNLEKIILDLKIPSTRGGDTNSMPPITSVYTRGKAAVATRAGEEVEPYFHIFNFGDNEGFAIMSGDDRVEPLLALTFKGELTPETEIDNPGFEIAYSRMEDYYVNKVSSRGLTPTFPEIPPKDSIPDPILTTDTIEHYMTFGYCPVKWDQNAPYNKRCTIEKVSNGIIIRDTVPTPVGCAAVAVAQLMAIYKYPNDYLYIFSNETGTFNWNDMTSQYPSESGIDQIANLMYLLGKPNNLGVVYRPYPKETDSIKISSGSNPETVPIAISNFGYTNGGKLIDYNEEQVVSELSNGYPILLRGSTVDSLGHIWLAHGLKEIITTLSSYHLSQGWITGPPISSYYILCNWGWKGKQDGYYLSNVFNTIEGPVFSDPDNSIETEGIYNFQTNIQAYINIRK